MLLFLTVDFYLKCGLFVCVHLNWVCCHSVVNMMYFCGQLFWLLSGLVDLTGQLFWYYVCFSLEVAGVAVCKKCHRVYFSKGISASLSMFFMIMFWFLYRKIMNCVYLQRNIRNIRFVRLIIYDKWTKTWS